MIDRSLAAARSAVDRFSQVLARQYEFDEEMAKEYNRAKRALAVAFQEMALSVVPRERFRLDDVKAAVTTRMRTLFEGRVDSSLFRIGGYTTPHPDLYALLAARVGSPVPGWRLRILSGDKIHTERRTRELRDLGLSIEVQESEDESTYCLTSLQPDVTYGAAFQLREKAIKSRRLSAVDKSRVVALAEASASLPPRRGTQ